MNRRHFIGMAAAVAAGAAAAWKLWPDEGLFNPCLGALPPRLAGHELGRAAWGGLDPAQIWDSHAHLLGDGDSGSAAWIGCAGLSETGEVDASYLARLSALME